MGKLTTKGFELTTQNEYYEQEKQLYKDIDALWDLDPSSPDGLKIAHDAEVFAALEEQVKQAYDARDPNKATGHDLDVLRALTGCRRSLGTPSTARLKITGVPNTLIRAESKVKTSGGIVFLTDEDVSIGFDGTIEVNAHCEKNGAISVSSNSLNIIVESVGGWQSVTNPEPATRGTDRDSDAIFRKKSALSVGRVGSNQKESIYGELFDTKGVRRVRIYENRTDYGAMDEVHNPHSLPPHSLAIVVDGGNDQDVAESIYKKLCAGVNLHAVGTKVEKTVFSKLFKTSYDVITFSRPQYVDIKINIVIKDSSSVLPENISTTIKQSYLDYFEGTLLGAGCGFLNTGFDIGDSIPFSRMYTPPNKILGQYPSTYVSELTINSGTANVAIKFNQLARFTAENITVRVEK